MRVVALSALAAGAILAGCGSSSPAANPKPASAPASGHHAAAQGSATAALRVVSTRALPAPVQLPALGVAGGNVLAAGGLDAADTSVSAIVHVAPGRPHQVGSLPQAVHDIGAATVGGRLFLFGGGTAAGPINTIQAVEPGGQTRAAGRLPVATSDTEAVTLSGTAYVVGGYTTTVPLRSVLAFRPGSGLSEAAALPHPLRYAAAAAVGNRILIAGGTDGVHARDEILSVDPVAHKVRVIGHLPSRSAHGAGAALGGTFYVLGGRSDATNSQTRAIWAIDPVSGRVRPAGRLPVALSDLSVVAVGTRLIVVGGRDRAGTVHGEVLELAPR
jgi:N-acetylneuraminic acid mutarotase